MESVRERERERERKRERERDKDWPWMCAINKSSMLDAANHFPELIKYNAFNSRLKH